MAEASRIENRSAVTDRSSATARVIVPFADLGRLHAPLKPALLEEIAALIDSGAFVNGSQVSEFESAFASFCGTRECVGVASGLDALLLGLLSAGLEPGDEVIVPAMTFAATAEAVVQAGGVPVLADISETDFNLDPAAVEAALTPRTRFVVPVHLYGQMADLAALEPIAAKARLEIIEDACQAHGALRDGRRAGTIGHAAAFSFYPAKNLGAMGDAGALVTDDGALAETVRALREHGQRRKYEHEAQGYTARLDTIQAIVLLRKLAFLNEWNNERRAVAAYYTSALDGVGDLRLPAVPAGSEPVWHLYVVRTAEPDRLADFLRERGIATGRHYPEPLHVAAAFAELGYPRGAFPAAERLAAEALSLPLFPGITQEQQDVVANALRDYFGDG